jgi:hypothetical protein
LGARACRSGSLPDFAAIRNLEPDVRSQDFGAAFPAEFQQGEYIDRSPDAAIASHR